MAVTMNNAETFRFIELYQAENCLWNPKNKHHKNKNIINDSWKRISDTMGIPTHELKKKKDNLMTTFRTNLRKKVNSLKSGITEEESYQPIWQFYEVMEVFLRDVYESKGICYTEDNDEDKGEDIYINEVDGGETSFMPNTGVQNQESRTSASPSQESSRPTPEINRKVQKRRATNPPELMEAGQQMSAAFNTLNGILQTKKSREVEGDDADLFCKLLAKQLRDFQKDEREDIMLEIHRFILNRRRRCRGLMPTISPSYNRPSSNIPNAIPTLPQNLQEISPEGDLIR